MIALDKTAASGLYVTGSAYLTVTGGGVQVNSNAAAVPYTSSAFYVGNMGNFSAPSIAVVGTTWLQPYGVGTVTPSTPSVGTYMKDPLANASPPISAAVAVGRPGPWNLYQLFHRQRRDRHDEAGLLSQRRQYRLLHGHDEPRNLLHRRRRLLCGQRRDGDRNGRDDLSVADGHHQ